MFARGPVSTDGAQGTDTQAVGRVEVSTFRWGCVCTRRKRSEDSEGQKVTSRRPCFSGGLHLQTNMNVGGIFPGLQPQPERHAVPTPSVTLGKPLGLLEPPFGISNLGITVTVTSQSCL